MILNSRNQWMDVAKGITILLMILGHAAIPEPLSNFIYSFHMPLFFIASGWMTNWNKYSISDFAIRKAKSLAVPFIIYSSIVLVLLEQVKKSIYGGNNMIFSWLCDGWQGYALWFIPVLFMSLFIVRFTYLISKGWGRVVVCICLLIIGVSLKYFKVTLPWSLSTVPYASFLVLLGSYLRNFQSFIDYPKWIIMLGGGGISLCISCFWRLDMAWNNILPVMPLTVGAVAGTVMLFSFSSFMIKYLQKVSEVFQYIGKETFVIVAFSQVIIILCNSYFICSSMIKYMILFISLWSIIFIKNRMKVLTKLLMF